MIARKNPGKWIPGTYAETAERYGLTVIEFRKAALDFLECEGWVDGHECQDLHEYLTYEPHEEPRDLEHKPDWD